MPFLAIDPTTAHAAPNVGFGQPEAAVDHPGGKSLDNMRTRLRLELGNRSTTDLPDPILTEWINDAYQDIYNSLNLPESKDSYVNPTVVDQPLYLIPPTVDSIRTVSAAADTTVASDGLKLDEIDVHAYRKLEARTGEPELWFRENKILVIWPTPDDLYYLNVDIRIKPWPLSLTTHYPAMEDKWHEVIFKAAKYRAWEALQNDTKSLVTMNEMSRLVNRKHDRDADDQEDAYPSMRPIFSRRDLMNLRRHTRQDND